MIIPGRLIVLTGFAGAGKTAMLTRLAAAGEQVIDLEALAAHRGSAYGRIGVSAPQPSTADFRAALETRLRGYDPHQPVWLEDEGPFIGRVALPPNLVAAMTRAEVVGISRPRQDRVQRLVETYTVDGIQPLVDATRRIRSRLGGPRTDRVTDLFRTGRPEPAISELLYYFDAAYAHRTAGEHRPTATGPGRLVAELTDRR